MAERVLVVDDEAQITRVLRTALSAQGYDVRAANDPEEALRLFEDWSPDLIVTDLMMPGMSGVELCRRVRSKAATPIIVLSVRDQERSKVEALDAGAHTVTVGGNSLHLTPTEFDLLLYMARNAGKALTHRALLTAVWGGQSAHQPEYLRVFIGQLRRKLEAEGPRQYIQTEPWVGYRFLPEGVPE